MQSRPARPAPLARWAAALGALLLCAGCGGQNPSGSAGASGATTTGPTGSLATGPATAAPVATVPPASSAPTTVPSTAPSAAPAAHPAFQYGDILKVQVNRLAARAAPKRSAAVVHGYNLGGPAPIDAGLVRLDKGEFVSVEMGPLPIGDTIWYLVWPSVGGALHTSSIDWYAGPPGITAGGPAWVAASVGDDEYLKLQRRPGPAEVAEYQVVVANAAGTGGYVSSPQPRHDGFLLEWAIAAPVPGTECFFDLDLAPTDADFEPFRALSRSPTNVTVSPLTGSFIAWEVPSSASWDQFTVKVGGSCTWAINLVRLDHD